MTTIHDTNSVPSLEQDIQWFSQNFQSEISVTTVFNAVLVAMRRVEQYATMTGSQKKQRVIDIIKFAISKIPNDIARQNLEASFDTIVPMLIEQIVGEDKAGNLQLKPAAKSFFAKIFPCCCSQ